MLTNVVENIKFASKCDKISENDLEKSYYLLRNLEVLITLINEIETNYSRRSNDNNSIVILSLEIEKEKRKITETIFSYIEILEEPHRFLECSEEFKEILKNNLDKLKTELRKENVIIDKIVKFLTSIGI